LEGFERRQYKMGNEVTQSKNFLLMTKTDFADIDFPEKTLSATEKRRGGTGWQLARSYKNLISGFQIGMLVPEKLQPGPNVGWKADTAR
jgi:hypothetical protein